jgi:NAD(P)-dependent dehydrogenase (short-subunit alcohol dehydrogenase family)
MAYQLQGKRVLITGASSGIGAALAEDFAAAGATVALCARRTDRLHEVLERCRHHSPDSAMWVADLADPDQVDRLAAEVVARLGGVDLLVNNAGIPKRRHVTRLDPDTVATVMAINYLSPVRLTLALLPQMLERGEGKVVTVSSVAAPLSPPGEAAYSASKAAITAFTQTMAVDLWDTGVTVMLVYPGVIDTELFTLPDNDPFTADVEALPVSEAVAAVRVGLDEGALEVYVPAWFADITKAKAQDVAGFMAGVAAYAKEREAAS